jgi:sulfide:quinone oxidoreductase
VTLVAPNTEFVYRPMSVREPFAFGPAQRYPLAQIANDIDAELLTDSLSWLDAAQRVVHIDGAARLKYDALLLGHSGERPPAARRQATAAKRSATVLQSTTFHHASM